MGLPPRDRKSLILLRTTHDLKTDPFPPEQVPRLLPLPSSASAASGPTSSTPTLPQLLFLSSLLALELLSILSWYRFLPVLYTLPYYLALAAVAVASGRAALGGMARRRKGQEVVEGKKQL